MSNVKETRVGRVSCKAKNTDKKQSSKTPAKFKMICQVRSELARGDLASSRPALASNPKSAGLLPYSMF